MAGKTKARMREVRLDVVPERHKRIKQLAKAEGSSIAVIVRRAINEFLERNPEKEGG